MSLTEDKAVLRFIEDALARNHTGEVDDSTSLGAMAIILSAWASNHPDVIRHCRRRK